jgi:NADPH:quinone reductase-like Zn-dependent oxidoreductase
MGGHKQRMGEVGTQCVHPRGITWSIGMRAIIIQQFGGLDRLVIENLPDPIPQPGSVLIEVKAFGINHAETHMRKGEWAEAATVSGIECVGLVKSCPGGEFAVALNVAAHVGAQIIATTRKKARFEALKELGAHRVEIESFNSAKFARRTRRWSRTKPMGKRSFASEVLNGTEASCFNNHKGNEYEFVL